ncbi:MAG: hypothetical protein H7Z14_17800 [Anaerolineae bacterium]|nr:hypothetical protein [Phycisphaerae bacterium]
MEQRIAAGNRLMHRGNIRSNCAGRFDANVTNGGWQPAWRPGTGTDGNVT